MKRFLTLSLLVFLLVGCSSSKLVKEWQSPDAVNFEANKVLVIGLAQDTEVRRTFEDLLTTKLERKGVIAVSSVDFFEQRFIDERKSEEELNQLEAQLLEAGFDAILFSKIIGSEDKVTLMQTLKSFDNFREDYYSAQDEVYFDDNVQAYTLFHAETNLYCICPEKERELLWSGNIDIVQDSNQKRNMRDYINTLVSVLQKRQLLIVDL